MKHRPCVLDVEAVESRQLLSAGPKIHGLMSGMLTVSADRQTVTVDSIQLKRLAPVSHFVLDSRTTFDITTFYPSQTKSGNSGNGVLAAEAFFTLHAPNLQVQTVFIDLMVPAAKTTFTRSPIRFHYKADRDVYDSTGLSFREFSMGTGTATLTAPGGFAHPDTSRPFTLVFKPSHH